MGRKNIITASAIVLALLFTTTACNKKLIRIQKDIDTNPITFDLPEIPVAGGFNVSQNATLDLKQKLDSLDIKLFELSDINIKEVTIDIADNTGNGTNRVTFDVLDNLNLQISAPDQAARLIAWKNPVPHTGLTQLKMDVDNTINLLPYALADLVTYRVYGQSNAPTQNPIKMTIKIKWHIVVEGPF